MTLSSKNKVLYQDETGYIKGHRRADGCWWISEIVVYPELRGKGHGKELVKHVPLPAKLLALPLHNRDNAPKLSTPALLSFYRKQGFHPLGYEHLMVKMVKPLPADKP